MKHARRRIAIVVAAVIGLLVVAALWPLGGRVPQRCVYDGDSASCSTLSYRSLATIGIAKVVWGGENTSTGVRTTPALVMAANPLPSRAPVKGDSTCGDTGLAAHYRGKQYPLYTCAGMLVSYTQVRTLTVRVGEKVTLTGLGAPDGALHSGDPRTAIAHGDTLVAKKAGTTAVTWPTAKTSCVSEAGSHILTASKCVLFELVVR